MNIMFIQEPDHTYSANKYSHIFMLYNSLTVQRAVKLWD